jgi:hypothetical protein
VKVPAIVTQELFDAVQKKLLHGPRRYVQPATHHLLRGLIECGECGSGFHSYRRYTAKSLASERCVDFDTRRQFLLDHIERVVYYPRSVELIGSIPGDLTGSNETTGAVPFRIEGKMRRIKTLLGPRSRRSEAVQGGHFIAV